MTKAAITSEFFSKYVRGQLEVQTLAQGEIYRGEIATARIIGQHESAGVEVTFVWLAKLQEGEWTSVAGKPWIAPFLLYSVHEISEGRLLLRCAIDGQTAVFFPPGSSTLDSSKVKSLT